jgi:hypothetical protein
VLLPAKSQQRLVQLLYFLPKMPQPLLANLSRCCTAGRISAGLAASLIRIIHLRWVPGALGQRALTPSLTGVGSGLCWECVCRGKTSVTCGYRGDG